MCCSQTFQERLGLGSTKDVQVNREIVTNVSTALSKLGSKAGGNVPYKPRANLTLY